MKPVTVWYHQPDNKQFEFNHIDDGHCDCDAERPTGMFPNQVKAWGKGHWKYEQCFVDDKYIIRSSDAVKPETKQNKLR